ncbi:hypothetical protein KAR91_10590 [Candidatus Pacearchaeota archaeon]|nr:hypothetical protein [Candidatus Pacearchaeota archaeon]
MADEKLTDQTLTADLEDTDIGYVTKDPSGTPLDRKFEVQTMKDYVRNITDLPEDTSGDGTDLLYLLKDPTGAALQTKINLQHIKPDGEVYINTIDDFPAPVSNKITLESKQYIITTTIVSPYEFIIPTGGYVVFESINMFQNVLVYSGTDVMFTGVDVIFFSLQKILISAPLGTIFDLDGDPAGNMYFAQMGFADVVSMGTIKNTSFYQHISLVLIAGEGYTFENMTALAITTSNFIAWRNEVDAVMLTIEGTNGNIEFNDMFYSPGANETIFDIKQTSTTTSGLIAASAAAQGSNIFTVDGKDQTDLSWAVLANSGMPSSTAKAKMKVVDNTEQTVISTISVPVRINALWSDGSIEERFVFQDECTFDNTTNLITFADHGMSDDDRINFHTYTGTLPAELDSSTKYYVVNITTDTFQVSLTEGGAVVAFTDDGTGTNYYRHVTGNTFGWVIYTGLDITSIEVAGFISVQNADATDVQIRTYLYESDVDGNITEQDRGGLIFADNTKPASSPIQDIDDIVTGEGFLFYISNNTSTDNLVITDAKITFNKA